MDDHSFAATRIAGGEAQGAVIYSAVPLSFWGGIDPASGQVIDRHHPLNGAATAGRILALPGARGSCTGSSVMLELLLGGHAPAALILAEPDEILALGVLVAEIMFGVTIPVVAIGSVAFAALNDACFARISDGRVDVFDEAPADGWQPAALPPLRPPATIALSDRDRALLGGGHGAAAAVAIEIILRMAALQQATALIDVARAHIDGCIYTGSASLRFAQRLVALSAQVAIPTTLNAVSVDRRRWRDLGIDAPFGEAADALAQAYLDMGARATFTCAPYLLDDAPKFGEQIVWAESNAVVFANSVLGARTQKYADFLDICIALTGRAPRAGGHLDAGRHATLRIDIDAPAAIDDAFWPLLGYCVGLLSGSAVPVLCGLEALEPSIDDYKAFGAAFATTSGAAMFHITGCTPEATSVDAACGGIAPQQRLRIGRAELATAWRELDSATDDSIQLVSFGSPHLSLSECTQIAALCAGRTRHPLTPVVLTLGRHVEAQARTAGHLAVIEAFGATIVTDTCWCMLEEPVVPRDCRTLLTNSAKYAHYAPGLVNRQVQFASLADCITAACNGRRTPALPNWLVP